MKEGYKNTELGWIPNEWDVKVLDEISNITRLAGAEYSDLWEVSDDGEIIALKGFNIGSNKLILDDIEKISNELSNRLIRSKLFRNDIVFPCVGTIGKATVIEEDNKYHINQNIAKITPNEGIFSLYLSYFLISEYVKKQIMKFNTSSSQPNVLVGNLRLFKVIVPTLKEQQKTAEILSTVDFQIDDTDKLIEKTKELKKGLMQRLLTKGIGHIEFKKTEVGEIPLEWEVRRLGEIVNIKSGNSPSKFNFCYDGKYPFFKVDDMNYSTKYLRVGKLYYNVSNFDLMNRGMIIFPKRGASIFTNKILILDSDGFFDTNLMGLICNKEVNNEFLYYFLSYYELSKIADTSSIPQINNKHIEPLIISLPGMKEQKEIANILSSIDNQIEEYENKKIKLEELKKGLMQQLLTGKIRVKV